MNPEVKQLWVEALLSKEYEQGRGFLRREIDGKTEYCCLGVLCDLYQKEVGGLTEKSRVSTIQPSNTIWEYNRNDACLPEEVVEWSGVENSVASLSIEINNNYSLAMINDSGATFPEIVEIIEEYL